MGWGGLIEDLHDHLGVDVDIVAADSLKDEEPAFRDSIMKDARVIYEARAYPNELIGEMRKYFVEVWLTERAHDYFLERDPAALPYLERFLKLPSYNVGHIA